MLLSVMLAGCAGMAWLVLWPVLPSAKWMALFSVLWLLGLCALSIASQRLPGLQWIAGRARWRQLAGCLAALLAGVWWAWVYCQWLQQSLWTDETATAQQLRGHITDFPQRTDRGWQVDFRVDAVSAVNAVGDEKPLAADGADQAESAWQGRVRLSVTGDEAPVAGCEYRVVARLKPLHGLHNFSAFDYHAWLLQAGYQATASSTQPLVCTPRQADRLLQWRMAIRQLIDDAGLSAEASATLQALLIGNYADIDVSQWQVLRDSGTIHLLSVSGLHIVFVAAFVYACSFHGLRWLVLPLRRLPAAQLASVLSLLVAVLYALLAGFSVATQRSLVMVAVLVLQRMLYGQFTFFTALCLSLFAVLLCNPLSVLTAGFWFSFLATALLMLTVSHRLQAESRLRALVRPQWLVFVLMAPVLLYVYGRMPLLSLPMNFFAVPWVSFLVLPLAFVALLLWPLSGKLALLLLQAAGALLDVYWWLMHCAVSWCEGWQLSLSVESLPVMLLAVLGLLLQCAPRTLPLRHWALLLCLPLLWPQRSALQAGEFRATVMDVGQGLAVVVETAKHTLVYDSGEHFSRKFDSGRDIVLPYLWQQRIRVVDMLMISHADSDHAGGARGLLDNIAVRQRWSGMPVELQQKTGREFLPCRDGMVWRWDGVIFRVLSPDEGKPAGNTNSRSCVLQIDNGHQRLMLTGDIDRQTESALIHRHDDARADVLQVPHHGSRTSSSAAFLAAVSPRVALISAGWHNRFHHPHREVVARYSQQDVAVLNTAETGALLWTFRHDGTMTQEKAVCVARRFWRDDSAQCGPVSWLGDVQRPEEARSEESLVQQ